MDIAESMQTIAVLCQQKASAPLTPSLAPGRNQLPAFSVAEDSFVLQAGIFQVGARASTPAWESTNVAYRMDTAAAHNTQARAAAAERRAVSSPALVPDRGRVMGLSAPR